MNDEFGARVEATAAALLASCREAGIFLTGDGRIGESDAAALLGVAAATLAARRAEGTGPPWFRLGGGGHRVSFRLADLAAWIEAQRVAG